MVELYGEVTNPVDSAVADKEYQKLREEFRKSMAGKPRKIGNSVLMMAQAGANRNEWRFMPNIIASEESTDVVLVPVDQSAEKEDKAEDADQIETGDSAKKEQQPVESSKTNQEYREQLLEL